MAQGFGSAARPVPEQPFWKISNVHWSGGLALLVVTSAAGVVIKCTKPTPPADPDFSRVYTAPTTIDPADYADAKVLALGGRTMDGWLVEPIEETGWTRWGPGPPPSLQYESSSSAGFAKVPTDLDYLIGSLPTTTETAQPSFADMINRRSTGHWKVGGDEHAIQYGARPGISGFVSESTYLINFAKASTITIDVLPWVASDVVPRGYSSAPVEPPDTKVELKVYGGGSFRISADDFATKNVVTGKLPALLSFMVNNGRVVSNVGGSVTLSQTRSSLATVPASYTVTSSGFAP